jgi:beta-lactamase superfamily II metal-dependent hydrolase
MLLILGVLGFPVLESSSLFAEISGKLAVHFINVGQADGILIIQDDSQCVIVIDAGDTRYPSSAANFKAYLTQHMPQGADIDLVVATHPHSDHIGSMRWVLETYSVKTYLDNGQNHGTKLYTDLMEAVEQLKRSNGLEYVTYDDFPKSKQKPCGANGPKIEALYPDEGIDPDSCEKQQNNCSVVTKLTWGETTFLFPGDAEQEEEELLLSDPKTKDALKADVLKVAHHGSDTSSEPEFLEAVNPSWMVISSGEKNIGTNKKYKHPRLSTVRNLLEYAGDKTNSHRIDTYDANKKKWKKEPIWGQFFVTAKDETVVLISDGKEIMKE